jgi:hypothetical protein
MLKDRRAKDRLYMQGQERRRLEREMGPTAHQLEERCSEPVVSCLEAM